MSEQAKLGLAVAIGIALAVMLGAVRHHDRLDLFSAGQAGGSER